MKNYYLLVFIMLVQLSKVDAQTYPSYVPSTGLDAWYSFTGNAKDSSGNGNNGTVNGATLTAGKSGIPNTAYSFNGTSNAIVLANPFLGGVQVSSFTIHSVVKFNSTTNGPVIWGKSFFWGEVFLYVNSDNSIRISWANTFSGNKYSKIASQPNVIQTGVWYNIDVVFSNSSGQIYLNGTPIATNLEWIAQGGAVISTTQIETKCNFAQIANSSEMGVFSNAGIPGSYLNGIIDEFGIWNRALTAPEILTLYGRNCVISNFNPFQDTSKVCGSITTLDAGPGYSFYSWNTGVATQSINVNSSGSKYLVTVINTNGCSATDSSYVDILSSNIVNNDTAICNVNSISLSTNSPVTSSQIVLYDFNNCNLNEFTSQLTEPGLVGSATSTSQGLTGCGVNLIRPATLTTIIQNFSYGTYEVDAKAGDGIANQGFKVMNIIDVDSRPSGTDDVGYGFYFNGVKVAFANGSNPVSYPNWYHIKVRITPDSIAFWLNSTLIYQANYQTPIINPYGPMAITTYSSSFYDNLKYTPYNTINSSFLWSTGSNSFSIAETTNSINVTPTQTTKYYCTVSNGISSCKDSVTVTVNAIGAFNPLQDTTKICGTTTTLNAGAGFTTYSWNTGATTQTISPIASGKYIVTVTNASGCTAIDSTYLSIVNANIINNDTTICKGSSVSLSSNGIYNFIWSTGATTNSINITPTQTTKYYCTVSNGFSSCMDSVTVTVSAIGTFNPLQDTAKICGTTTTLNAGAGFTTYSWNTGATTQTISPIASGKYIVTVTNALGCTAIDSTYLSIVNANILQNDTAICKGSGIKLSVDSVFGGSTACIKSDMPNNLQNGLVAYYPFCGNATDMSGNGNNGTVNGATLVAGRSGISNTAYSFNGTSNTIDLANPFLGGSQVNAFTFHTIVKLNSTANSPNIWGKTYNWGEVNFSIQSDNSVRFIWANYVTGNKYSNIYSLPNVIQTGVWYDIVVVFSNSSGKIYINGIPITTNLKWTAQGGANISTTQIEASAEFGQFPNSSKIGMRYTGGAPGNYFNGIMDEFGIWNRALTQLEVQQLYSIDPAQTVKWSTGDTTNSINVSPTQTTKYYCTVSNGISSCMDSVTVTVNEIGTFNPLQDTIKVCGTITTLDAGSGFTTYNWNTGATTQTITPISSGNYTVTVTNASGCTAIDSTYLGIVNANILNNDTTICKGNSLQLTSELNNLSRSSNIYNPGTPNPWSYPSPADGGYIPLGTFGAPSVFSISCYINPSDIQASIAIILDCNHGGSSNWVIQNYPNISSGSNWSFGALQFSLTPNTWQHLLITYNNGQKKAYVNGVLQASSFETINWSGNPKLFLGNWPEGARRFHGGIDELYITYDIQQTANFTPLSSITTPSTNLFGLWHFDEGIGTTTANNGGQLFSTNNWIWQNLNPSNAINYQWSTGETTNSINVTPSKTTKYYCTVSNGISNCMDSVTVTVVPVDTSLMVLDPPKICTNGGSVRMQAGVASTYKWLKNGVVIPSATSSLYSALQTGIYRVVVTNSVGCSDTSRAVDVTLYPLPSGTVKTPASNNICSGSSLLLTATGGDSYQWKLNGNPISGANSATYEASVPGEYTATLISSASCSAPATGSITLSLLSKPKAAFSYQNNCVNVPVLFSNASNRSQSGAVTYAWSFGNGAFSSQSTPSDQLYTTVGNYIAKLVIVSTACPLLSDTISKVIKIVAPENGTRYPAINVIKNVPYLLQARDIGVSYSWLPLSGISDPHISNPSYNYSVGADYRINITNAAGCTTVDSLLIRAFDKTGVYVPKAFAPNGNGNNDLLRPILVRITTINYFRVYNRWGQLIYQTKNIGEGWNGTFKGATQPIETYTWIFEGVDYNGIIIRETGKTTLLR